MSETTTTTRRRSSKASRGAAQAEADQAQAQPEAQGGQPEPQAQEQEQPKQEQAAAPAKKEPMGPSKYRERFGSSDAVLTKAVRVHFDAKVADLADAEIVSALGWSYTERSAFAKISALLAEREAAAKA